MASTEGKANELTTPTQLEQHDTHAADSEDKPLLQSHPSDLESNTLPKRNKLSDGEATSLAKQVSSNAGSSIFGRGVRFYLDNYLALSMTASMATAVNGLCLRVITQHISVFQVVLVYSVLGLIFLSTCCTLNGIPIFEPRSKMHLFLLRGFIGALGFLFRSFGQFKLPVAEFAFVSNSYPAVTAVVSWAVGMEQLTAWTWVGIVGSLVGNALIAHPPFLFGGHEDWGMHRILGLASAGISNFFVAITFLIIRHVGKNAHPMALTAYMHFFAMLCCIPFLSIGYPIPPNARHSIMDLINYIGSWSGLLVQLCIARSLQLNAATKVTSIYMTNMVFSCFLGVFVLSEKISWVSGIGAIVTVISVLVVTAPKRKIPEKYVQLPTVDNAEEVEMTNQAR